MANKEMEKASKGSQNINLLQTQEARVIMYIVPALLILGIIAYLFKQ